MHIGHDCKFLYMIKQDGKSYRLSETVQERDLGALVQSDLGVIPVYWSCKEGDENLGYNQKAVQEYG